jgi:hypothetical protein
VKKHDPKHRSRRHRFEYSIHSYIKWKKIYVKPNDFSSTLGPLKCPKRKRKRNYESVVLTSSP